jgi:hypothetical protein
MQLSSPVVPEAESADYGACRFGLDGRVIVARVARTTPTKIGQFVTLWKRPLPGAAIAPLAFDDPVDIVLVSCSNGEQHGQFVFDKRILVKQGVFSSPQHDGKRAMRVYPPWSHPVAKDAVRTQQWQRDYFLHFSGDGTADVAHTRRLFGCAAAR